MADPSDANGDGISGVPNYEYLPSFITPFPNAIPKNGKYIHRFGKKAAAYNLLHQTVNAVSYTHLDVYKRQLWLWYFYLPHRAWLVDTL